MLLVYIEKLSSNFLYDSQNKKASLKNGIACDSEGSTKFVRFSVKFCTILG